MWTEAQVTENRMAKSIASSKTRDTVRTTKIRAGKTPTKAGTATKTAALKAPTTKTTAAKAISARGAAVKAGTKQSPKDSPKAATKGFRKATQPTKGNGQVPLRLKAIRIKQTKAQILQTLTEETGLARKDVAKVMATLATLAKRHVMKRGSGEFAIPELGVKVRRVQRKARMARNPMTGEPVRVPAKTAVKATVLKTLKDAVL